jgi:hypothetical protein
VASQRAGLREDTMRTSRGTILAGWLAVLPAFASQPRMVVPEAIEHAPTDLAEASAVGDLQVFSAREEKQDGDDTSGVCIGWRAHSPRGAADQYQ